MWFTNELISDLMIIICIITLQSSTSFAIKAKRNNQSSSTAINATSTSANETNNVTTQVQVTVAPINNETITTFGINVTTSDYLSVPPHYSTLNVSSPAANNESFTAIQPSTSAPPLADNVTTHHFNTSTDMDFTTGSPSINTTTETVNPCIPNPCTHMCNVHEDQWGDNNSDNTVMLYNCSCPQGHHLLSDNHTCFDINECVMNPNICGAVPDIYCYNEPGSYQCRCLAGYIYNNSHCVAAPKRFLGQIQADSVLVTHIGTEFAYSWTDIADMDADSYLYETLITGLTESISNIFKDMEGFVGVRISQLSKGSVVIDYDLYFAETGPSNETFVRNNLYQHLASSGCNMSVLSSHCNVSGLSGIVISSLGLSEAVNPCLLDVDNDCDHSSTTCVTHVDGTYECQCKKGFIKWPGTNFMCHDIDECTEMLHDCNTSTSECHNSPGSFQCSCLEGYTSGEGGICHDSCDPNPCRNDGRCMKTQEDYFCRCQGIWTGLHCDEEHEEALRYKLIALIVGVFMGLLCLILLIGFILACCRNQQNNKKRSSNRLRKLEVRMDEWEYERQTPHYQSVNQRGLEEKDDFYFSQNQLSAPNLNSGRDNFSYDPEYVNNIKTSST